MTFENLAVAFFSPPQILLIIYPCFISFELSRRAKVELTSVISLYGIIDWTKKTVWYKKKAQNSACSRDNDMVFVL